MVDHEALKHLGQHQKTHLCFDAKVTVAVNQRLE
jgi:hypothetical protein